MIIDVTEEDIKNGWNWAMVRIIDEENDQKRCYYCPIAISLKRTFNSEKVIAATYYLMIKEKKYRTPEIVSDFMLDFDYGKQVTPFSYELDLNELYRNPH